ncbi:MAG: LysR family transcriptional regulator [Rhizobiaceae bacterium]|nr:LysR family transcriptional regulator [Rhizobiaceae bacterium]
MMLSHLNSLRALEATLRHGSFTVAADELGITPAAVGQRVRTLEEYVGKNLFERTSSGIIPLDDAKDVERLLTSGFISIASGLEQLKLERAHNRVSVTLPASFAENWLMPSISDFYRRHSEIDLRLDASNRDADLLTEDFDFAIRYGQPTTDPLQEIVLFGDYILPVCSPEFATRHNLNPQCRSLAGIPLIHMMNRTSDPSWVGFEGWGQAFKIDPDGLNQGVKYSKISSGLQSAILGQGLVICGLTEAHNAVKAGSLVFPFGPSLRLQTHYQYRLIWVQRRKMTSLQDDFRNWILQTSKDFVEELSDLLSEAD